MIDSKAGSLPPVDSPMIVDLFAGPGGLDVAAHWLGVPAIGIELDESAVDTREAAGLSSIVADVTCWRPGDFTPAINVLTGGPPCQTYTVAGNGHGRRALTHVIELVEMLGDGKIDEVLEEVATQSDPRTGLVLHPLIWALRALDAGHPYEAIMLEQVPAVKPVWEAMKVVLESRGYGVDVDVLRTEEYGVPQTRRRAVLAARWHMPSAVVCLPAPTHQRYVGTALDVEPTLDFSGGLAKWVSMAEALGWDEPFTVVSNYGSGGDPKNRCRRRHDRPAFTVTGKVSRNRVVLDGTRAERRFGPSEAGLLQTFPRDYPWSGRDVAQQIGNAIPPRLGTHVLAWLLGIEVELDEAFFAARADEWTGPDEEQASLIRNSITRTDVLGESITKIIGAPARVGSSDHGELVGVVGRSAEVDAVEPESGYGSRAEVAVGAAP
ncbi:DNA cytosine methyltransferase [Gordonia sp. (in: high G+C Gram-positive bacteria)]|uniref:DNA cytosine methyltransferase n=1 Tax=Gordonia sp. (in: high G+C Gram-positive bacteria) TaxID=84139 RepID=UPI003C752EE5